MGRQALVAVLSAGLLGSLAGAALPAPPASALAAAVERLPVAFEAGPASVASAFGGRSDADADGDGCDTSAEVLLAEAVVAPHVGAGCSLAGGRWRSAYDGVGVTGASALQVATTVPLQEAWRSGAAGWDTARRAAFANDLDFAGSLTAVTRAVVRRRGSADPARWLPPLAAARCAYAADWVAVKGRWSLSVDAAERAALLRLAQRCGSTPVPTPAVVPLRPASAVTGPPPSLAGVNSQQARYGTGADPQMITLGPTTGGGGLPYAGKTSMEFELPEATPVLAPLDMWLVGFDNRSAVRRTTLDGRVQSPFDDLELCFESAAPDWQGLFTCVYHVRSSPLLLGQGPTGACSVVPDWIGTSQAAGHLFYERDDYTRPPSASSAACGALLGRLVRRGEVIAYAGAVGQHTFASFRFKVPAAVANPLVRKGDRHLHWVQPGSFFYWACFGQATVFSPGVLGYPFECEGYRLPAAQREPGFKLR